MSFCLSFTSSFQKRPQRSGNCINFSNFFLGILPIWKYRYIVTRKCILANSHFRSDEMINNVVQINQWVTWDVKMSWSETETLLGWRAWQDGSNYYNLTAALSCEWEVISQSSFLETVAYVQLSCPFICVIIMFLCVGSPSGTAACWWFPKIADRRHGYSVKCIGSDFWVEFGGGGGFDILDRLWWGRSVSCCPFDFPASPFKWCPHIWRRRSWTKQEGLLKVHLLGRTKLVTVQARNDSFAIDYRDLWLWMKILNNRTFWE